MKLETFNYVSSAKWSVDELPALDSDRTLVIVFGASDFIEAPDPIHEIARAYPRSHVVGCSTAGEIFGTALFDASLSVGIMRFDHTSVTTAIAPVQSPEKSYAAGESLARQLDRPSLRGILVLSDGRNTCGAGIPLSARALRGA